jgi:hypothetical protein
MRTQPAKPGRTARITEEMNAVDIAEMEAIAELDLAGVTGGCAACGCANQLPSQQQQQQQQGLRSLPRQ